LINNGESAKFFFCFFVRYEEEFQRRIWWSCKFCQRFRLSKFAVTKLLDQVHCRTLYIVLTNSRLQSPWSIIRDGCGLGRWRHCQL